MRPKHIFLILALIAAKIASPVSVEAQCQPFNLGIYYAELKNGFQANVAFFEGQVGSAVVAELAPNRDESCKTQEALLEVTLPPGCTEANILLEFDEQPDGWLLNLGDSPENDGFGGDAGGLESEAELQILNDILTVYSKALGPNQDPPVDLLARADLRLTEGALQFVIRDQYASWGQPFSFVHTENSQVFLELPDEGAAEGKENTFYVGLNRVITGRADRIGCGVRRVLISFH